MEFLIFCNTMILQLMFVLDLEYIINFYIPIFTAQTIQWVVRCVLIDFSMSLKLLNLE